jgi:endoglycosylceramidase
VGAGALRRILCALTGAALLAVPSSAHAGPALGHAGRWFTDDQGRVLMPHGVAVMDFGPAHLPEAVGFGDDDAAFLAAHGFDVVRVGFNWSGVEPQPGVIDDAYVGSIERTVATLALHGIYSVIDLHQDGYGPMTGTDGAPDWATLTDGAPNNHLGFGPDYFANPALERAFDNLWANTPGPGGVGIADRFAAMLAALGQRFRDQRYVLGYDIFNEPWPGSQYPTCMNPEGCPVFDAELSAFYRRAVGALRAADPNHLAFAEPNLFFDFGASTHLQDPWGGDGGAAGFAFHDYCLGAGAGDALPPVPQNGLACPVEENMVMQNAIAYAEQAGAALINTEWGATDDVATTERVADELDAAQVPWAFWQYNSPRFVADPHQPPTGSNVNQAGLAAVDRPHARAVAGVPTTTSWDSASDTFRLTYATAPPPGAVRRPGAVTEVWTSPLHFPGGYRVEVSGARVISAPGAAVLVLRNSPGASEVRLQLAPR